MEHVKVQDIQRWGARHKMMMTWQTEPCEIFIWESGEYCLQTKYSKVKSIAKCVKMKRKSTTSSVVSTTSLLHFPLDVVVVNLVSLAGSILFGKVLSKNKTIKWQSVLYLASWRGETQAWGSGNHSTVFCCHCGGCNLLTLPRLRCMQYTVFLFIIEVKRQFWLLEKLTFHPIHVRVTSG